MLRPYTKAIRAWNNFFDGPFSKLGQVLDNAILEMEGDSKKYSGSKAKKEIDELKDLRDCINKMAFTHMNWINGF